MLQTGEQIRKIRQMRGYNQEQLAELASLNRVTVAKYESGKVEPGAQALSRIADALEVTVDELLGRDSLPEPDHVETPHTSEARILASGIDKMPKESREKALNMMKIIFDEYKDYFERTDPDAQ